MSATSSKSIRARRSGIAGDRSGRDGASRGRAALSWKKDPGGRRQRVLDEATRLFAQRGYGAVSTGDIARAAGVAEGSVFHYFGSKPELLRAVGARYGAEFAAAMFSGIRPVASLGTIERIVAQAFDFVEGNWPGFGLFLLSDDPSAAPLAQRANRLAVTSAVEGVLEAWNEQGLLQDIDAHVVAEILFGVVEAALRACFTGGGRSGRERYVTATVTAISRVLGIGRDIRA